MDGFDKAFARLKSAGDKVTHKSGSLPKKFLEDELTPAYRALCAAYEEADTEARINIYLFFESRDNLLDALTHFSAESAKQSMELLEEGKPQKGEPLLKQAIAANLIVNERCNPAMIEPAHETLMNAIDVFDFDFEPYASKLDLPAAVFAKRSLQLYKTGSKREAMQSLGVALEMNPELAQNPKAVELAQRLTGKPGAEAVSLLSDPFHRVQMMGSSTNSKPGKKAKAGTQAESSRRFWLITIFGVILLLTVPPILSNFIFIEPTRFSGVLPGVIIGTITSILYLWSRLRKRPQ